MRPPAPRAIAEQWPAPQAPTLVEGTVTLPDANTDTGRRLDFSFARASGRLTPALQARLQRLQVSTPSSPLAPIENGPYKGLYVINNKWHAKVEGVLYRITPEAGGSATIVDPLDPLDAEKNGPSLRVDKNGHWHLDLRLRLLGGAPPKRVEAQRRVNLQRVQHVGLHHLQRSLWRDFGRGACQRGDTVAACQQFGEYGQADKTGGANQCDIHENSL